MSEEQLAALREQLSAIPSSEVDVPDIPMATVLQEGSDLLTVLRDEKVWSRLLAIGVDADAREALEQALGATRTAQSLWMVTRDRQKSDSQRDRERRGAALRLELLAAGRYNLREDRVALGTLSAIAQGEGVADLIQDLSDLAMLIEQKRQAFERDRTFDASQRCEEARSLSSELSAGTSGERLSGDQATAMELRNRAYTHLDDLVSKLREAGRYAFRADEKQRKNFASRYLRRKRKRSAANDTETVLTPASE